MSILLIYPPVSRPCEPPAGLSRLAGALRSNGIRCSILDANLEGLLFMLENPPILKDKWSNRAYRNLERNLTSLRSDHAYRNLDRYKRAVSDLNRLLEISTAPMPVHLALANYQDERFSPIRSEDLIRTAETPEENPFFAYFRNRLPKLIDEEQPSIIGFSINFLAQALCAFSMIGFIKREYPGLKVALGGGLITSWVRRPGWRNPFQGLTDSVVCGPGERALLSLMGINHQEEEVYTPDFSSLPLHDYIAPGAILPYSASTGCYWNKCSFCPERAEGNPYAPIPPEKVQKDLERITQSVNPVLIHFLDNALSPALMHALCAHPPGVPWYGFARITRHFADLDFCMALKRSGCAMLKLGLESGDQGVLDKERKGTDIEIASQALRNIKRAGIATYVYLLFGTPSETLAEARKTLEFTVRRSEDIDFLNLAIFNLPLYGPEARELQTKMIYEGDLSLYVGFSHPLGWHRGRVRQFLDKEFKRHPAVAAILRNEPPVFTSNHAPFFAAKPLKADIL